MSELKHQKNIFVKELLPHMDALKTFAYHLTYSDQDAEDLVQETYLRAHKFEEKYIEGTNAKAWLFKILKNAYINEFRKKVNRPKQVDFEDFLSFQENETKASSITDLRQDLFTNQLGDEVSIALNSLPEEFRTVILLCDIEEFSYEDISKILGVPIGTVRSRLFRARNMLKGKLKRYAEKLGFKDYRGLKYLEEEE